MSVAFRFAHLSDTHILPDAADRSQLFADQMAEIGAGDYAFAIHTGDLMEEPSAWAARAFRTMASMLRIPVYLVPGNHDVYNPHLGEIEAPWWAKLAVDSDMIAQYRAWFGPNWYTFSHQGTHLVAVDSLIINSGLPEEREQWTWLEQTLASIAARRPQHLILFTHLMLFVRDPYEHLDPTDFRNGYLVIAPPGRDRLLDLVRRHRVNAVLTGHAHAPWEVSHTWPEGFTTRFVTTGSSGCTSPLAIEHFDLPLTPVQGLGFHEHQVDEGGLTSRYCQHSPTPVEGRWCLGQAWATHCPGGGVPTPQDGVDWYAVEYRPTASEWRVSDPASPLPFARSRETACFVRQTFEAEESAAAIYLELRAEGAVEIYLNGERLYSLEALGSRPPAWRSAGGTYTIDSPLLSLGLSQRLVRRGRNVVALRFEGGEAGLGEAHIGYRLFDSTQQPGRVMAGR
jgi:3',5'-cyclic AMP phosphodiesterase CpdA